MTAFEKAQRIFDDEPCASTFWQTLNWYMHYGYVITSPGFFLAMRPVPHLASKPDKIDHCLFDEWDCDEWHIAIAAGDMREMFVACPFPLDYISFEKRNRLKVYHFQSLRERLCNSNLI